MHSHIRVNSHFKGCIVVVLEDAPVRKMGWSYTTVICHLLLLVKPGRLTQGSHGRGGVGGNIAYCSHRVAME